MTPYAGADCIPARYTSDMVMLSCIRTLHVQLSSLMTNYIADGMIALGRAYGCTYGLYVSHKSHEARGD